MDEILQEWLAKFGETPVWLVLLGLAGQVVFMSRMVVQWIASERAGESIIPVAFWWLSLGGAAILLFYAVAKADPVFILAQAFGFIVYTRNLTLIRRAASQTPPAGG